MRLFLSVDGTLRSFFTLEENPQPITPRDYGYKWKAFRWQVLAEIGRYCVDQFRSEVLY